MTATFRFKGSLEVDDGRTDLLWQLGCLGLHQDHDEVVAYFPDELELPFEGQWRRLPEVDYLESYRRDLKPVRLERLVIAPSHRRVLVRAGQRPLWLDPGQAFGTGHHETTRLALRALEALDLRGRRVLDVGSGSGILAIAADLLGAAVAFGVDTDPVAVEVARDNAAANLSRASFAVGTLPLDPPRAPFDVIVANLYAELHTELVAAYAQQLAAGGSLLLTGILGDLEATVVGALGRNFGRLDSLREGEWTLVCAGGEVS